MNHILNLLVPNLYTKHARLTVIWNDFGREIWRLSIKIDPEAHDHLLSQSDGHSCREYMW